MWRAWRRAVGYPRWIGRPHMRRLMTGRSARRPAWRACGGDGCLPLYIPGAGWRSLSPGGRGLQVAGCEQRAWENECAKGNELGVLGVFYSRCRTVYRPPARFSQGSKEKCCVEWSAPHRPERSAHPPPRASPLSQQRASLHGSQQEHLHPASQFHQCSASQHPRPKVQI